MVALVEFDGGVTLVFVGGIIGATLLGLLTHEWSHILAYATLTGSMPDITVGARYLGIAITPDGQPPRWKVAIASLAPVIPAAAFTWYLIAIIESFPVNWRYLATVVALVFAAAPSPGDLYTLLMYNPNAERSGVVA